MSPERRARKATTTGAKSGGFTDDERAAMRERARELKAEARASRDRAAGEADLLAKVAKMPEPDRAMATRLHAIVTATGPELMPKTWYGMPAYANADGKVVCFFQGAHRFKTRYATLGFTDAASLDDGAMWPTGFGMKTMGAAEETKIRALVKKAVG